MPPALVLTFVDYVRPFESVETIAVRSVLVNQGVEASHVGAKSFAAIDAPLGYSFWIMKSLVWEEKNICVGGRLLSKAPLADNVVLFSRSTNETEMMLKELNETGKRIGLQISRKRTQFMKSAYCDDGEVQREGSKIVGTSFTVYLGLSMNMENDVNEELNRRRRATLSFASLKELRTK